MCIETAPPPLVRKLRRSGMTKSTSDEQHLPAGRSATAHAAPTELAFAFGCNGTINMALLTELLHIRQTM